MLSAAWRPILACNGVRSSDQKQLRSFLAESANISVHKTSTIIWLPKESDLLYTFDEETVINPHFKKRLSFCEPDPMSRTCYFTPNLRHHLGLKEMDYLKEHSPLLSTLASILCQEDVDDIQYALTEEHFNMDEYVSVETEEDIRQYRQRMLKEEYPILGNYVSQQLRPFLKQTDINTMAMHGINSLFGTALFTGFTAPAHLALLNQHILTMSEKKNFENLVQVFDVLSLDLQRKFPVLVLARDVALLRTEETSCLLKIRDPDLRIRACLHHARMLPIDEAIDLLLYFEGQTKCATDLKTAVALQLAKLRVLRRVSLGYLSLLLFVSC